MEIRLAGQEVQALSVGGVETCFQLPAFDACLDIGRCPPGAIGRSRLLLTHAHMDHAAGLPYYVSMRAMRHLPPPRILCPAGARAGLQQVLDTWTTLDADASRCALEGVEPGERIGLGGGAFAETFRSPHRVETIGYCLVREKKKLKPALHGLDGPSIAARARSGEDIHDVVSSRELCFPGDTSAEVVEREERVRTSRLLLLECTFIGARPGRRWAHEGGHVHLDDIAERADLFENEAILLTHFSTRYRPHEIRQAVDARLPSHLRERIHLLLHEEAGAAS